MRERDSRVATAAYAPEPSAAAEARRFVRETLRSWGVPGSSSQASALVDDAVLLTSELVTNAVVHAGTQILLSCRMVPGGVEVAVTDRHPARALSTELPAVAEMAPAERTSGRGLMLPSALASAWGVAYNRAAKVVWFRIALDDAGASPAADGAAGDAAGLLAAEDGWPGGPDDLDLVHDGQAPARDGGRSGPGGPAGLDPGGLSYDELLRHTAETARAAADADAAYALVADEDGELRMRAAAGLGQPALLDALAGAAAHPQASASKSVMTVPLLVEGRVTGILAVASGEPDRFSPGHSVRLQRVADRMALSLERARLGELERARRGRVSFLAEASDLLAGTLDQEKIVALAAQLVVPRLATWCGVLLSSAGDTPRPAYVWHADESRLDALARLFEIVVVPDLPDLAGGHSWSIALDDPAGLLSDALGSEARGSEARGSEALGSEALASDALPPDALALAADSAWCFPLVARGRSLGVLTIGRPRSASLPREVAELAEDLARRTALAIDNAQLYERQQQTTRALQRSLLPPDLPHIPGLDVAVAHEVAGEGNEVGGDFYDVFAVTEDRWRFAIGDVCGTGPEAAAVTGLARHTLRILAAEGYEIAAVLERLNRLLLDSASSFITLVHGEIRTGVDRKDPCSSVQLSVVCAGHPLPLLLRAAGPGTSGAGPEPAAEPQPLLGVIEELTFGEQEVSLYPGDLLLCVTDGVTERREGGLLLDDDDGLAKLFADCGGLSAGGVAARIQRAVSEFGTGPAADDMALLVLRAI